MAPGKSHGAVQPQVALGTVGCPPQGDIEVGHPLGFNTYLPFSR